MLDIPLQSPHTARSRRFGRKALQSERLARVFEQTRRSPKRPTIWQSLAKRPKLLAALCVAVIAIGLAAAALYHSYDARLAVTRKVELAKQQEQLKAKSIAADACRRKKVEQKADQIGKVTYDQLYDHNECDK